MTEDPSSRRVDVALLVGRVGVWTVRPTPRLLLLLFAGCASTAEVPAGPGPGVSLGPPDAPLFVVALHGRGDTPENFARPWRALSATAEVWVPRAPQPRGPGWQGFDWPVTAPQADVSRRLTAETARLWPEVLRRARGRPVVVLGFSQGAVLSYALAAQHPDALALALPIAGLLPEPLGPTAAAAPVVALHGTADRVIDVAFGRDTVARFRQAGGPVTLHEFPGVGHTLTPQMQQVVLDAVQKLAARSR